MNRMLFLSLLLSQSFLFGDDYDCFDIFDVFAAKDKVASDAQLSTDILMEKHSLRELVNSDLNSNLAVLHPSILMSAPQIVDQWINVVPKESVKDPEIGGKVYPFYPTLSSGLPINGHTKIVGQYASVNRFAENVKSWALGNQTGKRTLLFTGPPGTGKTAFLDIIYKLGRNLATNSPDHFLYTFRWKNLQTVPKIAQALGLNHESEVKIKSATSASPFLLLPSEFQSALLEQSAPIVTAKLGYQATPFPYLNAHDSFYRDALIEHYSNLEGKALNPAEVVKVLDGHVEIVRFIPGLYGKEGRMDAQGKDVDYAGLFFSNNPLLFTDPLYGPSHPLSYNIDGLVPQSFPFLALDEFFRNPVELRDIFLTVQESLKIRRGGAPEVPLNAVIIAVSNTESVDAARENSSSGAQLNRMTDTPMLFSTSPTEILHTILYMHGDVFKFKKLNGNFEPSPLESINLDLVFGKDEEGIIKNRFDGNYILQALSETGKYDVIFAPRVLSFIASLTSVTRMKTDPKAAVKFGPSALINDRLFLDPVHRLKLLNGDLRVSENKQHELRDLVTKLREGESGLTTREVSSIWLDQCIKVAQRTTHKTITIRLALEVFKELLSQGSIKFKNVQEALSWQSLADSVYSEIFLPKIEDDILLGLTQSSAQLDAAYDEVMNEVLVLSEDPEAKFFTSSSDIPRSINFERLREVKEIYKKLYGRELNPVYLSNFKLLNFSETRKDQSKDEDLYRALSRYYADAVLKQVSLEAMTIMAHSGEGNERTSQAYRDLINSLHNKFGYDAFSIKEALAEIERDRHTKKDFGD